jgi:vacuolar-type H+-ATPase subunit F/Vma7
MLSTPEEKLLSNPIAIVGEEDLVEGFKALGFRAYPVRDADGCRKAVREVMAGEVGICLLQDDFYNLMKEDIADYNNLALSIIIPFSKSADTALLDNMVKGIRLRATGAL